MELNFDTLMKNRNDIVDYYTRKARAERSRAADNLFKRIFQSNR